MRKLIGTLVVAGGLLVPVTVQAAEGVPPDVPAAAVEEWFADGSLCEWYLSFLDELDYYGVDTDEGHMMFDAPGEDFSWESAVKSWFIDHLAKPGLELSRAAQDATIRELDDCSETSV